MVMKVVRDIPKWLLLCQQMVTAIYLLRGYGWVLGMSVEWHSEPEMDLLSRTDFAKLGLKVLDCVGRARLVVVLVQRKNTGYPWAPYLVEIHGDLSWSGPGDEYYFLRNRALRMYFRTFLFAQKLAAFVFGLVVRPDRKVA